MSLNDFGTMIRHQSWADQRLAAALYDLTEIPVKSKKIFDHIIGAQNVWIARMENKQPELEVWPMLGKDEWLTRIEEHSTKLLAWSGDNSRMEQLVTYRNTQGATFTNSISEIFLHLVLHSQYHRGQVVSYAIDKFSKPPVLDMIAFMRIS